MNVISEQLKTTTTTTTTIITTTTTTTTTIPIVNVNGRGCSGGIIYIFHPLTEKKSSLHKFLILHTRIFSPRV